VWATLRQAQGERIGGVGLIRSEQRYACREGNALDSSGAPHFCQSEAAAEEFGAPQGDIFASDEILRPDSDREMAR
jgi:hypothetical protein